MQHRCCITSLNASAGVNHPEFTWALAWLFMHRPVQCHTHPSTGGGTHQLSGLQAVAADSTTWME
jgi:hypothetical protein